MRFGRCTPQTAPLPGSRCQPLLHARNQLVWCSAYCMREREDNAQGRLVPPRLELSNKSAIDVGPEGKLFLAQVKLNPQFLEDCRKCLSDGGVVTVARHTLDCRVSREYSRRQMFSGKYSHGRRRRWSRNAAGRRTTRLRELPVTPIGRGGKTIALIAAWAE
jgi:hypothetical protein